MRNKAKSLLIHNDTNSNKTYAMVVDEKNLLKKSKEFFKNIPKKSLNQGIILKAEGNETKYAVAYEKENFIIVSKKNSVKSARLYGNWNEALNFVRNLLKNEIKPKKDFRIILAEYPSKN